MIEFLFCFLLSANFAFHGFTSLLWLYEKRRRGCPEPSGVAPHTVVAWVGEGLALSLATATWVLGFLPGRAVRPAGARVPVVLVHGWGMTRASMALLASRLRQDGRDVYSINYPGTAAKMDDKAKRVASSIRRIVRETGSPRVDVVAHSLGGVVVRAAAKYEGIEDVLGNVVTLGSPHRGSALTVLFRRFGLIELRPGSPYLERLESGESLPARVHFTSIYSNFDQIVFPADASFLPSAFNVEVDGVGHMGMLLSERVYRLVKENLDEAVPHAS